MTSATVSAEPDILLRYADGASNLDHELTQESARLTSRLDLFASRCSERQFRVTVWDLGNSLRQHGDRCLPVEGWVRQIGHRFLQADGVWGGGWSPGAASDGASTASSEKWNTGWVGSVAAILIGALMPGVPSWLLSTASLLHWVSLISRTQPDETTRLGEITGNHQEMSMPAAQVSLKHKPETAPSEVPSTVPAYMTGVSIRAEVVPAYDPNDGKRYPRASEKAGKDSNCTWYAASAIKAASGGRIDLHNPETAISLGNAVKWPSVARAAMDSENHKLHSYIRDVNRVPAPGAVLATGNHVAFVEEVKYIEVEGKQKLEVIVSEEDYFLATYPNSQPVSVLDGPNVKRWRRTITYDIVNDVLLTDDHFIHFNY